MAGRGFASRAVRAALAVALCCAMVALAQPVAALAAGESLNGAALNELTSQTPPETHTTTTSTTATRSSESNGTTSRTLILVAIGAAVLVLCAIGYVIVRDARRVAPAGEADLGTGRPGRDTAAMMRRRRAKAKAARKQRKRNR
jgi:hypothetical protein